MCKPCECLGPRRKKKCHFTTHVKPCEVAVESTWLLSNKMQMLFNSRVRRWLRRDSYIFLSHFIPFHTPPSGTRQTPTTVPHLLAPLHCTIPGALPLPSPPLTLLPASPAGHLSALVYELSLSAKLWSLKRFLRDLRITGPPRGTFTLLVLDSIY